MQKMQEEMANERMKTQGELEAFREKTMAEVQAILIKAQVTAKVAQDIRRRKIRNPEFFGNLFRRARRFRRQIDPASTAKSVRAHGRAFVSSAAC